MMAGALYVLSAFILWYVILCQRRNASGVVYDRAIGWSALAVLFTTIAAGRLGWVRWSDVGWVFVVTTFAVMLAGLVSVRTITYAKFGNSVLVVFVAVVLSAGVSTWLWG
jgi:hypothetical protein